MNTTPAPRISPAHHFFRPYELLTKLFLQFGILPFLLLTVIVLFGIQEPRFLSEANLTNVARQSTFLMIVAMAQLLVLITGNMDLSVGALVGLVGVVTALILNSAANAGINIELAIAYALIGGLGSALVVGLFNGFCVAVLGLSSFIATLGTMTALTGIALTLSGGVPVSGIPYEYMELLSIDKFFGIQAPILATIAVFIAGYLILHHTTVGRYMYAIGSNERAAHLSGIGTKRVVFSAYALCALFTGITALLILARTGTGGANTGAEYGLSSVTACVIAGASLFGGTGRIGSVVLGALFLSLLSNGMNILQVQSYIQMIVIGLILIIALVGDKLRMRMLGQRG